MHGNPQQKKHMQDPVFSLKNKLIRAAWGITYSIFFRPSPTPLFSYRRAILRAFGAEIGEKCHVYPTARIWLPENLSMGRESTIGPGVQIYNQGKITLLDQVTVSQGAHICASTHDYNDPTHPLILAPITIESKAWVCADAFIGPGVTVTEGCVIGARAVLSKTTEPWSIYAGNPAKKIKERNKQTS